MIASRSGLTLVSRSRQITRRLRSAGRLSRPGVLVAAAAVALFGLHVLWFARFRWGYVTEWDEAGYLTIAIRYLDGLTGGPAAFLHALPAGGVQPPVVTASAVPLMLAFGRNPDVAQVTGPLYSVVLVLATYGMARRLMAPRWAALAALLVGTAPAVSDYTRVFHFAVPAAAFLTAALWALLSSEGLRRTRWVVAAGVLLALMLLSRTMTISYAPGVMIATAVPLLVSGEERALRLRNFTLLWVITIAIAALWWAPAWHRVWGYLRGTGYGSEAARYGTGHPILSTEFWVADLRGIVNHLYAPLAGAILVSFLVAAAVAVSRRRERRPLGPEIARSLSSDAFLLGVVVLEGYAALLSTVNTGTGFPLPFLPSLIVLGVAAAATVPARAVRLGLAALLGAVAVTNLGMKNGVSAALSKPRYTQVPVVGRVTVLDGRDFFYQALANRGHPPPAPPAKLPAVHKRWSRLNDDLAHYMDHYATRRGEVARVSIGTGDYFINNTHLQLAYALLFHRFLEKGMVVENNDVDGYRRHLISDRSNFLILSDRPRLWEFPVNPLSLAGAALELHYRPVRRFRAPDGRHVLVWWRSARSPPGP
jgi:hypothetical protein